MRKLPREYWYVIAIGIIFFIAFCLAIVAQFFKDTNCVAGWASTFFSEWALVLSASATLLLAIAALWAILDNRHSRIRDYKRRSLEEIRGWAQDAFQTLSPPGQFLIMDSETKHHMEIALRSIAARSISTITDANEFGGKLKEDVDKAATNLDSFIEKLWRGEGKWVDFNTDWENLKNNFLDVIGSASELRVKITLERF